MSSLVESLEKDLIGLLDTPVGKKLMDITRQAVEYTRDHANKPHFVKDADAFLKAIIKESL